MIATFDAMEGATLSPAHLEGIPEAQGVYQLLLNEEIVYVGKTDSGAGLRKRLARHAWTIQHRSNLRVDEVSFKAVRVFVFTAMDIETGLISHYKQTSVTGWNGSGFGSNDPGRGRDRTRATAASFDGLYPINLDESFDLGVSGTLSVQAALKMLRETLPYTLRIESSGRHPDFEGLSITVAEPKVTARSMLESVVRLLPSGWQATALAGRIILYKERVDDYPAGRIIARS